jgi:aromatic-L-amino-acid decarboxylase
MKPSVSETGDLPLDEFRREGHKVVDWIADYLATVSSLPVVPKIAPGDVAARLPASAPEQAESLEKILGDFERIVVPGTTHWNHPGFMAYFAISASTPGILGEMLAAALDSNAMLWKTGPAATELELRVMGWLRQAMGLPDEWFGLINDTASISTMLALAAAREAHPELRVRDEGMAGRADLPALRVYTSEQSHSSVDKGAITLGIGQRNVVHVPVDAEFRMRADVLGELIAADRAAGMLPMAAVATLGTTSTSSVDPVAEIADICTREGVWLHVDASYAGVAAMLPEMRHHFAGVERADSVVVNPHKWLFTPVDISAMYTRRPDVLKRAFSLVPEYLVTHEQDQVVNLMDYGVQLGRRFRALKLWFVMRAFGLEGLRSRLRHHCDLAQRFAAAVREEPGWVVMAPVPFSLVCFRYAPSGLSDEEADAANQRILDEVNAAGDVFLSHTKLNGRFTIRLAIGNIRTEWEHIERAWELLRAATGVPSA